VIFASPAKYRQKFILIQYEAPSEMRSGPISIPIGLERVGSFCNGMMRRSTKIVWMFNKACGITLLAEFLSFPQCEPSVVYEKAVKNKLRNSNTNKECRPEINQ